MQIKKIKNKNKKRVQQAIFHPKKRKKKKEEEEVSFHKRDATFTTFHNEL